MILVLGAGTQALLGLQLVIGLSSTFEELPTIWHVIHGFPLLAVALAPSSSLSLSSFIGLHGQGKKVRRIRDSDPSAARNRAGGQCLCGGETHHRNARWEAKQR